MNNDSDHHNEFTRDKTGFQMGRVRLDTSALDGLRGLAAWHIALGHYVANCTGTDTFAHGLDLMGGASIPAFYTVSGFVMVFGYGQSLIRRTTCGACDLACCMPCDCCCGCNEPEPSDGIPFKTKDYMRKRLTRLLPVYYLTNAAAYFLMMVRCGFHGAVPCSGVDYPTPNVVVQAVLTFFLLTSWTSWPFTYFRPFNFVTWTISTIFFFYLCFPAILPRLQRLSTKRLQGFIWFMFVLQVGLFLIIYASPLPFGRKQLLDPITSIAIHQANLTDAWDQTSYWAARTLPPIRLPVFVMGCCAAFQRLDIAHRATLGAIPGPELSTRGGWRRNAGVLVAIWLALVLASISIYECVGAGLFGPTELGSFISYYDVQTWPRVFLELTMPLVFCNLIVVLALDMPGAGEGAPSDAGQKPTSRRCDVRLHQLTISLFHSKPLQFLGEISMSFYMVHTLVLQALQELFFSLGWGNVPLAYHGKCPVWLALIGMLLSLFLGWMITEYFEKPVARCLVKCTSQRAVLGVNEGPVSPPFAALEPDTQSLTQATANIRIRPTGTPPRSLGSQRSHDVVGAMAYQQSTLEPTALSGTEASPNRVRLVRSSVPTDPQGGEGTRSHARNDDACGYSIVESVRRRDRANTAI